MALNTTLVKSTVVAALGGLLFGFDTAVIAGATAALTDCVPAFAQRTRYHRICGALGNGFRLIAREYPWRPLWTPRQPARDGHLLSGFSAGLRVRHQLVRALVLPFHRRPRHRRLLRPRPHVHHRNRARQMARPPGWIISIQRGRRNSDRLFLELHRRPFPAGWTDGVAVEARHLSPARRSVLPDAVRNPAQPALARPQGPHRRSPLRS